MEHNRDNKRSKQTRRNRKKHGRAFKVIMTIVLIFVITTAMLVCMAAAYIKNVIIPQADLQLDTFDASMSLTSTMYCRNPSTNNYEAMQTLYGDENRVWVTLDEIPQDLIDAAVAIEDKRFYQHNGVDWRRTINGVLLMFTGRDIQGGSTLTQQLIKNLTTEDDVTVKRKITEIFRALELEQNYTKDQILTWYLNYIYLGEGCNGVYTASYKYFGKHVSQLSLAECASLIGITNNPSKYDPLGRLEIVDEETGEVTTSRDFNKQRQETILYAMLDQGYITQEEYDEAVAEELNFDQGRDLENNTTYTWYEDAVIDDVINDLMETYNWSEEMATQMVFSGGLEIYTCMNPDVQAAVDEIYNDQANLNFTSSAGQQLQSAITVVDNETGEVVAMAGGMGKKTTSRGWNRATDTKRPPGSSIKPLSVYAPALELGVITPSSTYEDSPYQVIDGKNWPVNATGQYQGTVSIAKAVRESINTVAVKVLADVTPQTSYEFMRDRFHIKLVEKRTIKDKEYTDIDLAPLALGGLTDGVSTYDMAAAYSVFPRQGVYKEPRTYSIVIDRNKQILLDNTQEVDESALSQKTCYYMTEMLKQVVSNGTGKNANFAGQEIAGKTGTTTSRKDLWFVGYTPYYTAAVWTGYDQQERLSTGLGNPSTTLWQQVMSKIHQSLSYKDFDKPEGQMKTIQYCAVSGMLPGPACGGHVVTGTFFEDDVPTQICTVHKIQVVTPTRPSEGENTDDETGGETENPGGETPAEPPADPPAEGGGE